MAWVIESQLDTWLGKTLLGLVAVAMFSRHPGHPGASRVAGDVLDGRRQPAALRQVPGEGQQAHRHSVITGIAVSSLAILVLLVNIGPVSVFAAPSPSVSVVIVYLAYLMVTVPALRAPARAAPA